MLRQRRRKQGDTRPLPPCSFSTASRAHSPRKRRQKNNRHEPHPFPLTPLASHPPFHGANALRFRRARAGRSEACLIFPVPSCFFRLPFHKQSLRPGCKNKRHEATIFVPLTPLASHPPFTGPASFAFGGQGQGKAGPASFSPSPLTFFVCLFISKRFGACASRYLFKKRTSLPLANKDQTGRRPHFPCLFSPTSRPLFRRKMCSAEARENRKAQFFPFSPPLAPPPFQSAGGGDALPWEAKKQLLIYEGTCAGFFPLSPLP